APRASRSRSGRLPRAVGAVLLAVAAELHRAPVAAAVLRGVVEGPATGVGGEDLQPLPRAVDLRLQDDADHLRDQRIDRLRWVEVEAHPALGADADGHRMPGCDRGEG